MKKISAIIFHRPIIKTEDASKHFVERVGDEIEEWLAPDPEMYPASTRISIPPSTIVSGADIELHSFGESDSCNRVDSESLTSNTGESEFQSNKWLYGVEWNGSNANYL